MTHAQPVAAICLMCHAEVSRDKLVASLSMCSVLEVLGCLCEVRSCTRSRGCGGMLHALTFYAVPGAGWSLAARALQAAGSAAMTCRRWRHLRQTRPPSRLLRPGRVDARPLRLCNSATKPPFLDLFWKAVWRPVTGDAGRRHCRHLRPGHAQCGPLVMVQAVLKRC